MDFQRAEKKSTTRKQLGIHVNSSRGLSAFQKGLDFTVAAVFSFWHYFRLYLPISHAAAVYVVRSTLYMQNISVSFRCLSRYTCIAIPRDLSTRRSKRYGTISEMYSRKTWTISSFLLDPTAVRNCNRTAPPLSEVVFLPTQCIIYWSQGEYEWRESGDLQTREDQFLGPLCFFTTRQSTLPLSRSLSHQSSLEEKEEEEKLRADDRRDWAQLNLVVVNSVITQDVSTAIKLQRSVYYVHLYVHGKIHEAVGFSR